MEDRRVRRTRDRLHGSLVELVLERGYRRLTVQDVLDRADVGRSTFYTHFAGKDDLLLRGGRGHLRSVLAAAATDAVPAGVDRRVAAVLGPVAALFRLVGENTALYHEMVAGDRRRRMDHRVEDAALRMVAECLSEVVRVRLVEHTDRADGTDLEVAVAFLVRGAIGLLSWWLAGPGTLSADDLFARYARMSAPGVESLLPAPR